jgi:peptidoglycan/LPS O-acetylase OafA/YrhL
MFSRFFRHGSFAIRYVSDSSYWLYLVHLPLILVAQRALRLWDMPAIVKFSLICALVTAVLLVTYQALVRYSWLGSMLNGPRRRATGVIFKATE